ncbi:MAG TPA: hypothetical protein VIV40_08600 [Kofleriaceae bacterium]
MTELREASTPTEQREAREEVADAQADLEAAAASLGISPETLRKAAAAARREERREELRPILTELLAEEREREREAAEAEAAAAAEAKGEKPKPKPATKSDEPEVDHEPVAVHWSERGIGELVK